MKLKQMKMKLRSNAPLPFRGQKRQWIKIIGGLLASKGKDIELVVDAFGGSGLLSHNIKQILPNARVIWNDYDDYLSRLNSIDKTNETLARFRQMINAAGVAKLKRIPNDLKLLMLEMLTDEDDIITIASNVLFSGKSAKTTAELKKHTWYNNVTSSAYNADGYLKGVERVRMDFRELLEQYVGKSNVLFILDPPYLSTDSGGYATSWPLSTYLDIFSSLRNMKRYMYFTSEKSQLVELAEWLKINRIDIVGGGGDNNCKSAFELQFDI